LAYRGLVEQPLGARKRSASANAEQAAALFVHAVGGAMRGRQFGA